mmetsp:Transcript_827/g.3367  ORF Transcript_827/g.3367 Transcript_827/m.3367 type:complete len:511 (+) Transcript_827:682-2214(+)
MLWGTMEVATELLLLLLHWLLTRISSHSPTHLRNLRLCSWCCLETAHARRHKCSRCRGGAGEVAEAGVSAEISERRRRGGWSGTTERAPTPGRLRSCGSGHCYRCRCIEVQKAGCCCRRWFGSRRISPVVLAAPARFRIIAIIIRIVTLVAATSATLAVVVAIVVSAAAILVSVPIVSIVPTSAVAVIVAVAVVPTPTVVFFIVTAPAVAIIAVVFTPVSVLIAVSVPIAVPPGFFALFSLVVAFFLHVIKLLCIAVRVVPAASGGSVPGAAHVSAAPAVEAVAASTSTSTSCTADAAAAVAAPSTVASSTTTTAGARIAVARVHGRDADHFVTLLAGLVTLAPQHFHVAHQLHDGLGLFTNGSTFILAILGEAEIHERTNLVLVSSNVIDDTLAAILDQEFEEGQRLQDTTPPWSLLLKSIPNFLHHQLAILVVVARPGNVVEHAVRASPILIGSGLTEVLLKGRLSVCDSVGGLLHRTQSTGDRGEIHCLESLGGSAAAKTRSLRDAA